MRGVLIFNLVFLCALAGYNYAFAQDSSGIILLSSGQQNFTQGVLSNSEQKVSLNLRNIDILEALKFFSMKTGLNIIPTRNVAGRVTLTVENVPLQDVFDIMLRSNQLAYDKKGEIYNVMTEAEYKVLYGKSFFDVRQVRVFRLKNAIPEEAFRVLDAIKSNIGRLLVEVESGTVLIMDIPEKIKDIESALSALEQKGCIKIFNLKYAKAKDVELQLKSQLDAKKVGTIRADERTNQIVVQTLPDRMQDIERIVLGLDKKTKAVLIDTKIIKLKLSDQNDSSVKWEGLFDAGGNSGLNYVGSYPFSAVQKSTDAWRSRQQVLNDMSGNVGSYPFSGTTSDFSSGAQVAPGEKMHVGVISGKKDFDVFLQYLQTVGRTKILSNPTISVVNNQEAKIHVGERRAFVTTTTTAGTNSTTVSEEVTYVDVGIQLSITPIINDDGYVTMTVKPEISSVIGNVTTSSNNAIPIIDTSTAETTVIAKDGATIMIGGLGKEERSEDVKQLPFFSKLPVVGGLFKTKTNKVEHTELLILLTPIIFEGDRLISAKDKENELYGVKPIKKFDVFRQEKPLQDIPEAENTQGDILQYKGFKAADLDVSPVTIPEALIPIQYKKEAPVPKGFKGYE